MDELRIIRYLDGEMSGEELKAFEDEVRMNQPLKEELERYRQIQDLAEKLLSDQGGESGILSAIELKKKKGSTYCSGKDLVIFSEAKGWWKPNVVARRIAGRHDFETVWVVHLEHASDGGYSYCVVWLDANHGNAPSWRVSINADFTDWHVERIQ